LPDTTDGSLPSKLDIPPKKERTPTSSFLDPETNPLLFGNFTTTTLMDSTDNPPNNFSDTTTLSLTFPFPKITTSVSHLHGTEPSDFGTSEAESPPNNSMDTPKKFSLAASPPATDKLSHLEPTKESNFGTLLLNANSPVKLTTTLNGFHALDTPLSSKLNPKPSLTPTSPPPVGTEDSRSGTPISKSEPLSNPTKDQ
jgi:hypothetical protein